MHFATVCSNFNLKVIGVFLLSVPFSSSKSYLNFIMYSKHYWNKFIRFIFDIEMRNVLIIYQNVIKTKNLSTGSFMIERFLIELLFICFFNVGVFRFFNGFACKHLINLLILWRDFFPRKEIEGRWKIYFL